MLEPFFCKHIWMLSHIDSVERILQDHCVRVSEGNVMLNMTYRYSYLTEGRILMTMGMSHSPDTMSEVFVAAECPATMCFLQTVADRLYRQRVVRTELSWTAKSFNCLDRRLYGMGEYWE